jgi:hypothetical protein
MQYNLLGQSSSDMNVSTEVEDIVLFRQQKMTDEGTQTQNTHSIRAFVNCRMCESAVWL